MNFWYSTNIIFYLKNYEELTKFIFVENLSFSFQEKVRFVDYYQNALNPIAYSSNYL